MSDTASVDVSAVLEKPAPSVPEVVHLREALCASPDVRRKVAAFVASLPSDVERARDDKALALKKGLALWVAGREVEAAAWLEHSGSKAARLFRASGLLAAGRPAEAAEVAREAGDEPLAALVLGDARANAGDADGTRAQAAVLAKAGRAADAEYLRGRAADLDGERGEARQHYRAALEHDEAHAMALFRLAHDTYLWGDEDEAMRLYHRCLDTPCPPVNAYLNLGNIYEDRGEFSNARDCYRAVLAADPTNARARMFDRDAGASLNMFYDEDLERRADRRSQILRLPVTDFELSVRSRNCLAKMGVRTLGDLIQRTEAELLSYKNFGETSLQEIKDILAQKGLRLGMARDEVARDEEARSILEGIGVGDGDRRKLLQRTLGELELSVRSRHCMNVLGLKTVGDLVQKSEADLMTIKNFGQTSMNEVKQKLAELGLSLASGK